MNMSHASKVWYTHYIDNVRRHCPIYTDTTHGMHTLTEKHIYRHTYKLSVHGGINNYKGSAHRNTKPCHT